MTPKAFIIGKTGNVLGFFAATRAEQAHAKLAGTFLVGAEKDLENVPGPVLVEIHNAAAAEPVKKFRDKATAAARVWPLLAGLADVPEAETTAADAEKAAKTTAKKGGKGKAAAKTSTKEKPAATTPKATTGKAPQFAGKKLKRTAAGNEAKRRDDTRRTASWTALKDGMTFEEAVKAGARPADLDKMFRLGHIVWK
jgi:hypothetical protein